MSWTNPHRRLVPPGVACRSSTGGTVKKPRTRQSISSDEQLARYAYVLGNVPASVADKAYAAAFAQLSDRQREVLLGELRAQVPDGADPASKVHPEDFALCMRDLHWRSAL